MTLAILLIGLVIATCFIAYIADNIGKNMGKKRISLFGLRPRQTATLISMASSVLIMLATVGILMATSQSLSNALLRYDFEKREANREKQKLLTAIQSLKDNLNGQREQIETQQKQIEKNRSLVENILAQRKQAESNFKAVNVRWQTARAGEAKARANAARAQVQLSSARRQFQIFKAQFASAKTQVTEAKSRVAKAQAEVTSAQQQLKGEQQKVKTTQGKYNAAQSRLSVAQVKLSGAQQALESAQEKQQAAQEQYQTTKNNLDGVQKSFIKTMSDLSDAQDQSAKLEVQRKELDQKLVAQRNLLEELRETARKKLADAGQIAIGDIGVSLNEVLAERTIATNLSAAQVREELHALLKSGRDKLSDPPRTINLAVPEEAKNLSGDEFLNGFAAYLSTLNEPVSVRLLSARNHARGEMEINAYLLPIVIRTVFKKDEVLGTANITAGSDASVFNQLLQLLNETEQRASDRGVTPLPTLENPLFYPTGTNERVFEALRKIQSDGGAVKVNVIAAEDISTADAPHVRFEIARQTSP